MGQRNNIADTHELLATAATRPRCIRTLSLAMEADAMPRGPNPPSPQIPLHHPTFPIGGGITSRPSPTEQGGQTSMDLGQDPAGSISVGRDPVASSKKGKIHWSGDARVEQHDGSRDVPISVTVAGKRTLSHASESSRARKAARTLNAKVVMTQLQNSKTAGRNMPKMFVDTIAELQN